MDKRSTGVPEKILVKETPVRSHSDILSLLKQPPVKPDSEIIEPDATPPEFIKDPSVNPTDFGNRYINHAPVGSSECSSSTQRILSPNVQNFPVQSDSHNEKCSKVNSEEKTGLHSGCSSQIGVENQEPHSTK